MRILARCTLHNCRLVKRLARLVKNPAGLDWHVRYPTGLGGTGFSPRDAGCGLDHDQCAQTSLRAFGGVLSCVDPARPLRFQPGLSTKAGFERAHSLVALPDVVLGGCLHLVPADPPGAYIVTLANGVRLQSGRMYHEKLKALAENPF